MGWWFFHEDYATQKDIVQEKVLPHEFGEALHNGTLTIEHVSQRSGEVYVAYTLHGERNIEVFFIRKIQGEWGYKSCALECGPYAYHCPEKILRWYEDGRETIPEYAAEFIARNRTAQAKRKLKSSQSKTVNALPEGSLVRIVDNPDQVFRIESHQNARLKRGYCELREVEPHTLKLFHIKYSRLEPCDQDEFFASRFPVGALVQVQGFQDRVFEIDRHHLAQGYCHVREVEPPTREMFKADYGRLVVLSRSKQEYSAA